MGKTFQWPRAKKRWEERRDFFLVRPTLPFPSTIATFAGLNTTWNHNLLCIQRDRNPVAQKILQYAVSRKEKDEFPRKYKRKFLARHFRYLAIRAKSLFFWPPSFEISGSECVWGCKKKNRPPPFPARFNEGCNITVSRKSFLLRWQRFLCRIRKGL